jgi:hypothetical protein
MIRKINKRKTFFFFVIYLIYYRDSNESDTTFTSQVKYFSICRSIMVIRFRYYSQEKFCCFLLFFEVNEQKLKEIRNASNFSLDSDLDWTSSCRMLTKQNSEFCRLMCFFPLNSAGVYRILREFFHDF